MRRILDRALNYDHDYDGRPPVEFGGIDPLLAALMRAHGDRYHVEVARSVAVKRAEALRELAQR
jgi:hypothetical protein